MTSATDHLGTIGLKVVDVPGDGNCLFHSCINILKNHEGLAKLCKGDEPVKCIRGIIAGMLISNNPQVVDYMKGIIDAGILLDDSNIADYSDTWAGHASVRNYVKSNSAMDVRVLLTMVADLVVNPSPLVWGEQLEVTLLNMMMKCYAFKFVVISRGSKTADVAQFLTENTTTGDTIGLIVNEGNSHYKYVSTADGADKTTFDRDSLLKDFTGPTTAGLSAGGGLARNTTTMICLGLAIVVPAILASVK